MATGGLSGSSFARRWSQSRPKENFDWPSRGGYKCQRTDCARRNAHTAAIFACNDGGIGVDPVLRFRRPVTPFGVGTILDGTGIGGGLEIVGSGCSVILWEVAGEEGNNGGRQTAGQVSSWEGRGCAERPRGTGYRQEQETSSQCRSQPPSYLFVHVLISLHVPFVVWIRKTLMPVTPRLTSSQMFNQTSPTVTTLILIPRHPLQTPLLGPHSHRGFLFLPTPRGYV